MAKGEDSGKIAANSSIGEPGRVIEDAARKNTSSCAMVTGIDSVCTSRTVVAIPPIVRNSEPSSR